MLPGAATQGQASAGGQAAHVPPQQVRELLPAGHQAVYCCCDCNASLIATWMYYSTSLIQHLCSAIPHLSKGLGLSGKPSVFCLCLVGLPVLKGLSRRW